MIPLIIFYLTDESMNKFYILLAAVIGIVFSHYFGGDNLIKRQAENGVIPIILDEGVYSGYGVSVNGVFCTKITSTSHPPK